MGLQGQKVVVIGGSSGIGFAVAKGALADGARVTIGSSNPQNVEAAVAKLGPGASGHAVDVKTEADVAAFFDKIDGLDHLVYTAGESLQLVPLDAVQFNKAQVFFVHFNLWRKVRTGVTYWVVTRQ